MADHLRMCRPSYELVNSGDVLNVVTGVMQLTRRKLLNQLDWDEWISSEFLQLNQYDEQGIFGTPVQIQEGMAVFHLVWTYPIKALDSCKKARWACDGSPHLGQARILDKIYANCVDQTSSRLFYAVSAAENLIIMGADVLNAFVEAPPPKQGFYGTLANIPLFIARHFCHTSAHSTTFIIPTLCCYFRFFYYF